MHLLEEMKKKFTINEHQWWLLKILRGELGTSRKRAEEARRDRQERKQGECIAVARRGTRARGLYPSLMRAWNPALSLRNTACPVEDSSPRWSNSHALTRDPRGGQHSPGTRKCSEEEGGPANIPYGPLVCRACEPSPRHVSSSLSLSSPSLSWIIDKNRRGGSIANLIMVCIVPWAEEGSTVVADRSSSDGESRVWREFQDQCDRQRCQQFCCVATSCGCELASNIGSVLSSPWMVLRREIVCRESPSKIHRWRLARISKS